MALASYQSQTALLLHDSSNQAYSLANLTTWINLARGQIASIGQCVRVLPTSNNTVNAQEVYNYSTVNGLIAAQFTGVDSIITVLSVAINQASAGQGIKPMLPRYAWGEFQAKLRAFNQGMTGYPQVYATYGQGVNGSIYLWPIPSGVYAMDWDCVCRPVNLVDDTTPEAIPYPWTDAIPFYAAYYAYMNSQRSEDAKTMFGLYKMSMDVARSTSESAFIPTYYGGD